MLKSIQQYSSHLNRILKYIISLLALIYIGYRIVHTEFSVSELQSFLSIPTLITIVILTIVNWVFEILKWKVVINTFSKLSFTIASYQTLVAYTYGMMTPFNSGNYAKKIFFYPKEYRKRIVFLNLTKGMYQMLVTVIFGSWGVYLLIDEINLQLLNKQQFVLITTFIGLVFMFVYRKKITNLIKSISLKIHGQLFIFSVVKFICFSLVLLAMLYQKDLSVIKLYAGICAIYLLSSLLPILNILDFAIKGSVALWLLPPLGYSEQNLLIAYFILWICNHAAPAILGSFLQLSPLKKEV